jgi:hypothetical protein
MDELCPKEDEPLLNRSERNRSVRAGWAERRDRP